jgi:hypothetical protein
VSGLRPSFPEVAGISAEERKDYARVNAGIESLENRKSAWRMIRFWGVVGSRSASGHESRAALTWFEVAARIDVEQVLPTVRTPRWC